MITLHGVELWQESAAKKWGGDIRDLIEEKPRMKPEDKLRHDLMRNVFARMHTSRIEDCENVPDLTICCGHDIWVELKVEQPKGKIILRKGQYAWMFNRIHHGGNCEIICRMRNNELWTFGDVRHMDPEVFRIGKLNIYNCQHIVHEDYAALETYLRGAR